MHAHPLEPGGSCADAHLHAVHTIALRTILLCIGIRDHDFLISTQYEKCSRTSAVSALTRLSKTRLCELTSEWMLVVSCGPTRSGQACWPGFASTPVFCSPNTQKQRACRSRCTRSPSASMSLLFSRSSDSGSTSACCRPFVTICCCQTPPGRRPEKKGSWPEEMEAPAVALPRQTAGPAPCARETPSCCLASYCDMCFSVSLAWMSVRALCACLAPGAAIKRLLRSALVGATLLPY